MKHRSILYAAIALIFLLTACSAPSANVPTATAEPTAIPTEVPTEAPTEVPTVIPTEPEPTEAPTEEPAAAGSNILVVYFSRIGEQYGVGVIDKGNTEIVADIIVEKTGADVFEILPETDNYPLTYNALLDVAKQEQNQKTRPAYAGAAPDLSGYDTIFIGAPVWWGDWPMIMYTFFEQNEEGLAEKDLIPFSTHAGSGLSGFDTKLAAALPLSHVGKGLAVSGSQAQNNRDSVRQSVFSWLEELGF